MNLHNYNECFGLWIANSALTRLYWFCKRQTALGLVWSRRGTVHGHSSNCLNKEILGNCGHHYYRSTIHSYVSFFFSSYLSGIPFFINTFCNKYQSHMVEFSLQDNHVFRRQWPITYLKAGLNFSYLLVKFTGLNVYLLLQLSWSWQYQLPSHANY